MDVADVKAGGAVVYDFHVGRGDVQLCGRIIACGGYPRSACGRDCTWWSVHYQGAGMVIHLPGILGDHRLHHTQILHQTIHFHV